MVRNRPKNDKNRHPRCTTPKFNFWDFRLFLNKIAKISYYFRDYNFIQYMFDRDFLHFWTKKQKKNRGFECKILWKSYLREMRRVVILSMSWIIFFGSVVDHFFAQKRNNKRSKKSERVASLMDKTVKRITNDYFDELIKIGKIHSFDISKIFKNFLITWPVIWDHVDGDHVVIMFWK